MLGNNLSEDKNHIEIIFGIMEGVESIVLMVERNTTTLVITTLHLYEYKSLLFQKLPLNFNLQAIKLIKSNQWLRIQSNESRKIKKKNETNQDIGYKNGPLPNTSAVSKSSRKR